MEGLHLISGISATTRPESQEAVRPGVDPGQQVEREKWEGDLYVRFVVLRFVMASG
jgi:hypothetical protein